jgi:hypothetical protein
MKGGRAKPGHYFYSNKKLNIMTKQETIDLLKQQLLAFLSSDEISNLGIDLVSDYDLSMNYKEVELDSIDLNNHQIKGAVKSAVQNWVEELKEETE